MPSAKKRGLNQQAVVWPYYGRDANGEPTVSDPIEINCRWEEGQRQVFVTASSVAVDAEVFVDREIAIGSMIWKGALIDLPDTPNNISEVVTYSETPGWKNRESELERVVFLRRWKDSLPTVV